MAYTYHFKSDEKASITLLLLHGTGGDEFDLVPLAQEIAGENISILSLRGDVNENGQLRFFKRFADGSFDEDDLEKRTHAMADFVQEFCAQNQIDPATLYALGYSNGANMTGSLLTLRPEILAGGIMLRAMLPFTNPSSQPNLQGKQVLILSGVIDSLLPPEKGQELAQFLEQKGADVTFHARLAGHELKREDIIDARAWLANIADKKTGLIISV